MDGTKLPASISKLGEEKEITLFVDGDRGGKLIAKNVCDNAKVAYIASAPDGKEVEELTGKEILQALRKKIPANVFLRNSGVSEGSGNESDKKEEQQEKKQKRDITSEDKKRLRELSSDVKGRNVLILNEEMRVVKSVPSSKLKFMKQPDAFVLVTDNATGSIVEGAEHLGAKAVAAKTFGKVDNPDIELISI
jgi:DNA primase